jgi:hypothetical protein
MEDCVIFQDTLSYETTIDRMLYGALQNEGQSGRVTGSTEIWNIL